MTKGNWARVSRDRRCPVCDHADWCLISADGAVAICGRIAQGAVKRCGQAGYLHRLKETPHHWAPRTRRIEIAAVSDDVAAMAVEFHAAAERCGHLDRLAASLGLSINSLRRFRVGWNEDDSCSTWPMSDATGRIVGITRRFPDGSKRIIPGHRAGLYMPADMLPSSEPLVVCEGASDAVAGNDLGLYAIGRFSCTHGATFLVDLIKASRPEAVVIVADSDGPGRSGAACLATALLPYVTSLKVVEPPPPFKDLRAWCQGGATAEEVRQRIEEAEARRLSVKARTR